MRRFSWAAIEFQVEVAAVIGKDENDIGSLICFRDGVQCVGTQKQASNAIKDQSFHWFD